MSPIRTRKGQPRRRRLHRRHRQDPVARMREARRARDYRSRRAARIPADRRHRRLRPRRPGAAARRGFSDAIKSGRASPSRRWAGPVASRSAPTSCASSRPGAKVWISDPSWENHRALFEGAGFAVEPIPTTTRATRGLDFDAMVAALATGCRRARSSCCTRAATTRPVSIRRRSNGRRSVEIVRARGLVPFLDIAYQGFGDGLDADGAVVRASRRRQDRCSSRIRSRSRFRSTASGRRAHGRRRRRRRSRAGALAAQADHPRELLDPADARRADRHGPCSRRPSSARCGRPSSRRCATGSSSCARCWSSGCTSAFPTSDFRFMLRQRGMFSYSGLTQGTGAAAARGVLGLRDRHRAHLCRGAQLAQRRGRRSSDRGGRRASQSRSPALTASRIPI